MVNRIGCGVLVLFMLVVSGCTDHSRNFYFYVESEDDGWNEIDLDVLVEKQDTAEESTNSPSTPIQATVPLGGGI